MAMITLTDGRIINGLTRNGNNFVSDVEIDESIFEDNCAHVTIDDGGHTETMTNAYLVQQIKRPDGYYFVLAEKTEAELLKDQLEEVQLALIELYEGLEA